MQMALKLGYATLRWRNPDLPRALAELKKAGWDGWEGRLSLDWMGPPRRLKKICDDAGMPMAVMTASGSPETGDWEHVERNKRRMDYAAEVGVDCFMFMSGRKPEGRPTSEDDIRRAAAAAEEWAEYAGQYSLELSYHIHTNLLIDSIDEWKLYMSLLEKAKLCIDVSHAELWGYDPVQSVCDFWQQLNYVHLQDYSACTVKEYGNYNPVWVDVGQAECLDFKGVLDLCEERSFTRWVTACPGDPPAGDDPISEARRSAGMREYLRRLGY
jgi:sugar phosphate isomerase/epimerase